MDPNKTLEQQCLTDIEHAALEAFAKQHGRFWRADLNVAWQRASYPGMTDAHKAALQRLRNRLGPRWLAGFRFASEEDTSNGSK